MNGYKGLKAPETKGWCAVWYDEDNNIHAIPDSWTRSKAKAQRIADEYMLEHQVRCEITECIF